MAVAEFLRGKGFKFDVIRGFIDNDIDMICLPTITESDLKELNIGKTFGERRRMTIAIQSLKSGDHSAVQKAPVQMEPSPSPGKLDSSDGGFYMAPLTRPEHYNIRSILASHPKGKGILRELNAGKMPSVKNRRALVQVTVGYLVENGGHLLYPTKEQKEALAWAIVTQFPCTKDLTQGKYGHEYLYHKGGGFLEYRLKTLRVTASRRRAFVSAAALEPQETSNMNIQNSSNHIGSDNIPMDEALHPSPSRNSLNSPLKATPSSVSPKHTAFDSCTVPQDEIFTDQSNQLLIPKEMLASQALQSLGGSVRDRIEIKQEQIDDPSQSESSMESRDDSLMETSRSPCRIAWNNREKGDESFHPSASNRLQEMEDRTTLHFANSRNTSAADQEPCKSAPKRHLGSFYLTPQLTKPEHFNIRQILESHYKGIAVLKELESGIPPTVKCRRAVVQVTMAHLIEHGGRILYPTKEQKEALAWAIVTQFPSMKDFTQGKHGHEYLYRKGNGFLEFRLKNLRSTAARQRAAVEVEDPPEKETLKSRLLSEHIKNQTLHPSPSQKPVGIDRVRGTRSPISAKKGLNDSIHGGIGLSYSPSMMNHIHEMGSVLSVHTAARLTKPENYNIHSILEGHLSGRRVLQELDVKKMLSVKNRRALVQMTVAYLVDNGGHYLYPTKEQKLALALAIVSQFPCTKDTSHGKKGHEYLYHKAAGYIEFRLKTLRRRLSRRSPAEWGEPMNTPKLKFRSQSETNTTQIESPSSSPTEEVDTGSCEDGADDADGSEETAVIKKFFKDTHIHRTKWIQESDLSISDIISVYHCYKDMPMLIDYDFLLKYGPEISHSLTLWRESHSVSSWQQTFAEPILAMAKTHQKASKTLNFFGENGDVDLCTFYILLDLLLSNDDSCKILPGDGNAVNSSEIPSAGYVFQHQPIGADAAAYAAKKPTDLTQPFLLCLGPKTSPEKFYLILDHLAIPAGNSVLTAFDRLFKAHYVFNVHYEHLVFSFYNFFASIVYKIAKNGISPQVREFYTLLSSQEDK